MPHQQVHSSIAVFQLALVALHPPPRHAAHYPEIKPQPTWPILLYLQISNMSNMASASPDSLSGGAPRSGDSAAAAHRYNLAHTASTSSGVSPAAVAPWRRAPSPAARSDDGAMSPDSVGGTPEAPPLTSRGGGRGEATTPAARAVPVPSQHPQLAASLDSSAGGNDTYARQMQWAAARQKRLEAARREAEEAEQATVTGTPRLCAKSEAMVAAARSREHAGITAATSGPPPVCAPGGGTHLDLGAFLQAAAGQTPVPSKSEQKSEQERAAERLFSDAEARLARAEQRAAELQAEEYPGTPAITRKAAALGPSRQGQPVGDRLHAAATAQQQRAAEAAAAAEQPPPAPPSSVRRGSAAQERLRSAMEAAHSEGGMVPPSAAPTHVKGGSTVPHQWRSVYASEHGDDAAQHSGDFSSANPAHRPPPAPGSSLYERGLSRAQRRLMQAEHEAEEAKTVSAPKLNRNSLRMAEARGDSAIERLYFAPVAKAKAEKEAEGEGGEAGLDSASVHSGTVTGSVSGLTADDEENCTFQPAISEHSRRIAGRRRGGEGGVQANAGERLLAEGRKRQERLAARRAEIEAEMLQEGTFEPNTIPDVGGAEAAEGGDSDSGPAGLKLAPATEAAGAARPKRQVSSAQASAMYQRMQEWQARKQQRIDSLRAAAAAEGEEECTFQPFMQAGGAKGVEGGDASRGRGPVVASYGGSAPPRPGRSRSSSPGGSPSGDAAPSANKHTVADTRGFASFMARKARARALAAEKTDAENALLVSRSRYAPDATLEHAKRTGHGEAWALGEGGEGGFTAEASAEADAAAYAEALRAEDEGRGGAGGFKPMVAAQTVLGAEAATVVSRLTGMAGSVASGLRGVSGGVSASGVNLPPLPAEVDARARDYRINHIVLSGSAGVSPGGELPEGVSFHGETNFRTSYATRHTNTVAVRDILVEAEKERNARSAQLQWAEDGGDSSDDEGGAGGSISRSPGQAAPLTAEQILEQADAALMHAAGLSMEGGESTPPSPPTAAPSARLASASRGVHAAAAAAARASGVAALGASAAAELHRREAADAIRAADSARDAAAAISHAQRSRAGSSDSDSDSSDEGGAGGSSGGTRAQHTAAESAIQQLLQDAATYTAHLDARRGRTEAAARELRLSPSTGAGGVVFSDEAPLDLGRKGGALEGGQPRRGGLKSSLRQTAQPHSDPAPQQAVATVGASRVAGFSSLARLAGGGATPANPSAQRGSGDVRDLKSRIDALVARTGAAVRA